ncbi:MAG: radical SAM protein [Magnetococcales bacterium]|nr:radical SAM protein [Magnetococcales bacterium]
MNILCLIPPYVPSYFNAGHHLSVFMTGAYLRARAKGVQVSCLDGAALNMTWRALGEVLIQGFDLVVLVNDFDATDTFERTIAYIRALSPRARILTVGRLSCRLPNLFFTLDLDAVHCSGDPETAVTSYLDHLATSEKNAHVSGVAVRHPDGSFSPAGAAHPLPPGEWILPDITEIPHEAYSRLYLDDLHKFCGIPERLELVVPVARGCPVGCEFCDVPPLQGSTERRLSVARTLAYISDSFQKKPFEYVSFYAPTFTLKKGWVHELCREMIALGSPWPWKCVTVAHHLDREMIALMGQAGCVRISIGIETLEPIPMTGLPKIKHTSKETFDTLAGWCRTAGIELNCFMILGLPGDTLDGVRATMEAVGAAGARLRTSIYTPYQLMNASMDHRAAAGFNRHLFATDHPGDQERSAYYRMFFGRDSQPTAVMNRIPRRQEATHG